MCGGEAEPVAVKEPDPGKSGYSFLVGEADVGGRVGDGALQILQSKVLELPSVLLGGQGCPV